MTTVVITGANRGIGLSLVNHYLAKNYQVHATYRSQSHASELFKLERPNLHCHQLDVTNYARYETLASQLPEIDILINNAGYYGPKGYVFGETDIEEWRKALEINTIAPMKLVEALYPNLKRGSLKKIACISSKMGSMGDNTSGGSYIYRSSKAALNSIVKSLSNDLASQDFTVLALHPGWVLTDMGGPNALINTDTSATGLIEVIDSATTDHSGEFINYDGSPLPW